MYILISGPIRPSEEHVCEVIRTIKSQIPNCVIFFLTWKNNCSSVKNEVNFYYEIDEPTDEYILEHIQARTIQQRELNFPDNVPCAKIPTYKMIYGVQKLCELASSHIRDDDIVMRLRTDSIFKFDNKYLNELIELSRNSYIAKEGSGFDWFALTTFSTLKQVWIFKTIEEYNKFVSNCWNPEDIIKRRVPVPISVINTKLVDCYILRNNGYKHYFA